MDKNRIEGAAKTVAGTIKQAAGKVLGGKKTEVDGQAEKTAGKLQNAAGGAKDAVRNTIKKK